MKSSVRVLLPLIAGAAFISIAGCGQPPTRPDVKVKDKGKDSDVFREFMETARYTDTGGGVDDWTRFRGGLESLNTHFTRPDVIQGMRDLAAANRKFLETEVHLTEDELAEVESTSFRTADAHYLDECFLLRDAARSLDTGETGDSGVRQAEQLFGWVMRNVPLHEQVDSWVPPAPTLRRGCGSAIERAMLVLALWRQAQIEGCLIVVPEKEPTQFLVASLDATGKTPSLSLFDPRLGLALKNKDAAGILSLREALAEPKLLQPAKITPEQAKKLEAWLVCPLYSLSPRLFELQRQVSRIDGVAMYLGAADLAKEIAKTAPVPVKVWNPPGGNSPTRCLHLFLPKQEGGLDEKGRAATITTSRLPMSQVLYNYEQIQFTQELLPKAAYQAMMGRTLDILNKYDLQPREMFVRGLYDALSRRYERLQPFVKDDRLDRLVQDQAFRLDLRKWQDKLRDIASRTDDPDPRVQARAQQEIQKIWAQDQFINWMVEIQIEEKLDPKHEKTVLTRVLAVGMRDYLAVELARSQACVNHERACLAQAMVHKNSPDANRKEAQDAWARAASSWNSFLQTNTLDGLVKQRLEQLQRVAFDRQPRDRIVMQLTMLENLHLDMHRYFQARLGMAECKAHREGAKAAKAYLEDIKRDIEKLESRGLLKNPTEYLAQVPPQIQARLDLLARDWSEQGSYAWLKQQIAVLSKQ